MQLTEKQLQVQEAIIKAVHDTDDIEEARNKEIGLFGCVVTTHDEEQKIIVGYTDGWRYDCSDMEWLDEGNIKNIIGLPPTLERVLAKLYGKSLVQIRHYYKGQIQFVQFELGGRLLCVRKLLKEDGTPASLRDQSEQAQERIASIILG